jgi:tripartite ATP-independent transporter DctM subunit
MVSGVIFGALSGSSLATCATLGSTLIPEMRRFHYSKGFAAASIAVAGTIDILIPPNATTVLYGALAEVSIGKLLIGGIIPGLLLASAYIGYIICRATLTPHVAPAYSVATPDLATLVRATVRNALPSVALIVAVLGFIYFGVTTPTEAAAIGALGAAVLAWAYRKLTWDVLHKSLLATVQVTGMLFLIMAGAKAYSQVLAIGGITRGLVSTFTGLAIPPGLMLFILLALLVVLGMFIDPASIMFLTIPIYKPLSTALGFDPVWFGVLYMMTMAIGLITPPFGLDVFAVRAVAGPDVELADIFREVLPFVLVALGVVLLVVLFPPLATWLPARMT